MRVTPVFFLFPFLTTAATLIAQQPLPAPIFHAQTNLVVVDVTVTDNHGKPVHGLTEADFALIEDGTAQTVKSFEVHESSEAALLKPLPVLPPGTYSNQPVAPANGALNVLLLDRLNTPMKDQSYVLRQLKEFLDKMPAGTRIAIFGLNSRLNMLQGFTSDPAVLRKYLENGKGRLDASVLMANAVSGDTPGASKPTDTLLWELEQDPMTEERAKLLKQFVAEQESQTMQTRARVTLDSLNQLARYLAGFKGRKNLLWFSGSFPINIMPDGSLKNPFGVVMNVAEEFRETSSMLTRSQVAVYPIDARGLMTNSVFEAANSKSRSAKQGVYLQNFQHDERQFEVQTSSEQDTMRQMATDTGGEAFVNTNGLAQAVNEAIQAGSNYYTLSYSPSNSVWHGEYRRVKVKVNMPGVTLAYRRGYYADDARVAMRRDPAAVAKDALPRYDPVQAAMAFGAPTPTEILFDIAVSRVSGDPEPAAAEDNHIDTKIAGPFVRYQVSYKVKLEQLTCPQSSPPAHVCQIEFVTCLFNGDRKLQNYLQSGRRVTVNAASEEALRERVYSLTQQISVPVKGTHFLRLGVADHESGKLGAIELPLDAVKTLPVAK